MVLNIHECQRLPASCFTVSNGSNDSTTEAAEVPILAPTHQLVGGLVVFLTTLPFVLFNFRFFPFGSNVAVLLGAFLMVATTVITQDEVYNVIGCQESLTPVFALIGTMMLLQYVEREQLLVKIVRKLLKPSSCFENYVLRVSLLAFLISALFTSDASSAVLTPLVLKIWESQERSQQELQTLLLGIATSANIGGVTTILGSPLMMIVAAKTSSPQFGGSRLDMKACFLYFLLPAVLVYFMNLGFLVLHFRFRNMCAENSHLVSEPSQSEQEMTGLTVNPQMNGHVRRENGDIHSESSVLREERLPPCQLETIPEDDILEIQSIPSTTHSDVELDSVHFTRDGTLITSSGVTAVTVESPSDSEEEDSDDRQGDEHSENHQVAAENVSNPSLDYRPSALTLHNLQEAQRQHQRMASLSVDRTLSEHGVRISQRLGIYRSIGGMSGAAFLPADTGMRQLSQLENPHQSDDFSPADSRSFHALLCLLVSIALVLLLAASHRFPVDIGLVPMAAATLAIMFDASFNRRPSMGIIQRADWSVILALVGVFVWTHGLNNTMLPHWLWTKVGLADSQFTSPWDVFILSVCIIAGTNLFGGLITGIVLLDRLVPCQDQLALVLYVAWCSSIAGNLTQFGSVTNLVVTQKALQSIGYRLTNWTYLKYGFLTTLLILPTGILIIYCLVLILI